jgi:hypothetical protein
MFLLPRFFFRGLATLTDDKNCSTVESVPMTRKSHWLTSRKMLFCPGLGNVAIDTVEDAACRLCNGTCFFFKFFFGSLIGLVNWEWRRLMVSLYSLLTVFLLSYDSYNKWFNEPNVVTYNGSDWRQISFPEAFKYILLMSEHYADLYLLSVMSTYPDSTCNNTSWWSYTLFNHEPLSKGWSLILM